MADKRHELPPAPEPLAVPIADNHCHLGFGGRGGDIAEIGAAIERAAAVGVTRIVDVGYDLASSRAAVDVAERFANVVAAVAIHPNDAARLGHDLGHHLAAIDELAAHPQVRAVGETGLDYFRTGQEGRPAQHESFRVHIDIARRHNRTLVIHDRDSHDDVLAVLDSEPPLDRVVMHCFSGDAEFAKKCLDRGAFLSFAGTVTFKNAEPLREALRVTPRDRILVETDAPFLTPEPHRGKRNGSYLLPHTVRFMADVLQTDLDDLCEAIDVNTSHAFGGSWSTHVVPSGS